MLLRVDLKRIVETNMEEMNMETRSIRMMNLKLRWDNKLGRMCFGAFSPLFFMCRIMSINLLYSYNYSIDL